MGIYELIEVDDELADLVKDGATTRVALRMFLEVRGLLGLRAEGFALVRQGVTSIEEVLRVT